MENQEINKETEIENAVVEQPETVENEQITQENSVQKIPLSVMKRRPVSCRLDPEDYEKIKKIADANGLCVSDVMEQSIKIILKKFKNYLNNL